jgi:cell division protein FtsA
MTRKRPELLVGLDIGTAKVAVVVVEVGDNAVRVAGIGSAPCEGMRRSVVVNIDATVQAISSAIKEAELSAGCEIRTVFASVGGTHLRGFNSHGVVPVKTREVGRGDVERVLDAARAVALPLDRDVLHVLPQEFVVDGQDGVREPVGMAGVRLEARVHVISTSIACAQNVLKCCQRAGLHVADLISAPLAAAEATLTPEEIELGVALIDVGAGTTGVIVFGHGAVQHTAVVSVGGNHITNDIAAGLRTPFREAEILKRRFGCAVASSVPPEETVEVPTVGGGGPRQLSRQMLAQIIEPRVEEILALAQRQLIRTGLDEGLTSGIVLNGGSVVLDGFATLAERVLSLPVRAGAPIGCENLEAAFPAATHTAALGLARYGARPRDYIAPVVEEKDLFGKVRRRMVGWLKELM